MIETVIKCLPKRKWNQSQEDYFEQIDVEVRGFCVTIPKEFVVPATIINVQTHLSPNSGVEGYVQFMLEVQTNIGVTSSNVTDGEKK